MTNTAMFISEKTATKVGVSLLGRKLCRDFKIYRRYTQNEIGFLLVIQLEDFSVQELTYEFLWRNNIKKGDCQ